MQNQINMGDRNTQQIGQNDVNQPVDTPEKPRINYLMIGGVILTCLVVFGFGGYYLGKQSSNKNLVSESSLTPALSPTPSEASDKTVNWTSHDITTEPLLGYADYVVKVPSTWKRIEHSSNFQDTETFQDTYGQFTYQLVIHQQKNYNEQTGKPYITLKELTGFPYDVTTLIVDGQQAARVLPRAGSESIYKVLFFSKDTKLVISIELDTPRDGSRVKDGEELFSQILSTFKFLDKVDESSRPTTSLSNQRTSPMPSGYTDLQGIAKAKLLSTNNWQTVSAKNFSIKVPPNLVPFVSDPYLIIVREQKEYVAEKPQFDVAQVGIPEAGYHNNLYNGGSRRQWYLDYRCKPYKDEPCPYIFQERLFGNINGLEVYQPLKQPGETGTQPTRIAVLVAVGTKLFQLSGSAEYSQIIDTAISTLKVN